MGCLCQHKILATAAHRMVFISSHRDAIDDRFGWVPVGRFWELIRKSAIRLVAWCGRKPPVCSHKRFGSCRR
jgi:hypothetical protein